jgi:hypothetical protein
VPAPFPSARWDPPVGVVPFARTRSRTRSLFPSARRARAISVVSPSRKPLSPSSQRAPPVSAVTRSLCSLSLSLRRGTPCLLRPPREPPLTRAHARREPWPHRLPTSPSSLLSPARTRSPSPASFCPLLPSLTLSHQSSPEKDTRHAGHPEHETPRQVSPSVVPR